MNPAGRSLIESISNRKQSTRNQRHHLVTRQFIIPVNNVAAKSPFDVGQNDWLAPKPKKNKMRNAKEKKTTRTRNGFALNPTSSRRGPRRTPIGRSGGGDGGGGSGWWGGRVAGWGRGRGSGWVGGRGWGNPIDFG